MPCNCGDLVVLGNHPPYANALDVAAALAQVAVCCVGAIDQSTDPIADPSAALNEGFPNGLSSDCGCDVIWLVQPDDTLFISANQGDRWFMVFNGGNSMGVLISHEDPNDGPSSFVTAPDCVDDTRPCWAYDAAGNIWASFDRGTTWLSVYHPAYFAHVEGTTGLVVCNDVTATVMTGGAVVDGESAWYNSVTGEVTVPASGRYMINHRIEFAAGALVSAGLVKSEILVNGATVLRESQVLAAAHGNASYPVAGMASFEHELDAGDDVQLRITIAGSGNETPAYFHLYVRFIER